MEYNWDNIKERCKIYVTHCCSELPENFVDILINDIYMHLIIDDQKKKQGEENEEVL